MKTKKISYVALKRVLFTAAVVFFALFQNAFLPALGLTGPVWLLIPLVTALAMAEHEFAGMLFGLLAGALWDLSSPVSDGVITLFFTVFACAAGLLTRYLLRNSVLSAAALTSAGALAYSLISFLFNCLTRDTGAFGFSVGFFYLRGIIYSAVLTPVFYYPVRAVAAKFNIKDEGSVYDS